MPWPSYERGDLLCGRFKIIKQLGYPGQTGVGYLVNDPLLEEQIVCKVALSPEVNDEFSAQYRRLFSIRQPGVVAPHGLFEHEHEGQRHAVIALEFVPGDHFGDWASEREEFEVIQGLIRMTDALAALHERGISHGDCSGGVNVLTSADKVVLIDLWPDLWGKTSDGGEYVDGEDVRSLSEIVSTHLPNSAGRLERALDDLLAGSITTRQFADSLRVVRESIRVAPDLSNTSQAAASLNRRNEELFAKYRNNLRIRHELIEQLAQTIRTHCEQFNATVTDNCALARTIELGQAACVTLAGLYFGQREISVSTQTGGRWVLEFVGIQVSEGVRSLTGWDRNTIARGESEVRGPSGAAMNEPIAITVKDGTPTLASGEDDAPIEPGWIAERINRLFGL